MVDFNPRIFGGWLQLQSAGVDFVGAYLSTLGLAEEPAFSPLLPDTQFNVRLIARPADNWTDLPGVTRSSLKAIVRTSAVTGWRFTTVKILQVGVRAVSNCVQLVRTEVPGSTRRTLRRSCRNHKGTTRS